MLSGEIFPLVRLTYGFTKLNALPSLYHVVQVKFNEVSISVYNLVYILAQSQCDNITD